MPTPQRPVVLEVELESEEAYQLAQFVKRIGWTEIRANAESDAHAYVMRAALARLAESLADKGYAPR